MVKSEAHLTGIKKSLDWQQTQCGTSVLLISPTGPQVGHSPATVNTAKAFFSYLCALKLKLTMLFRYLMSLRPLLILLFALTSVCSCKRFMAGTAADAQETDTAAIDGRAAEREIAALTDTARQEQPAAKPEERVRGSYIYVSKRQMRLYVLTPSDSILFSCGIACGMGRGNKQEKGDNRTPEGSFRIAGMYDSTDWIHRTKDGREVKGCYGPHFLSIGGCRFVSIGIHGTNMPRSIGRRASEGCIRVLSKNIITLFDKYAYNGMRVIVSGEDDDLPFYDASAPQQTLAAADAARADSVARREEADAKALAAKYHADSLQRVAHTADSLAREGLFD